MKNVFAIAVIALASMSSAAILSPVPMGIEISEENGITHVREVARGVLGTEGEACRECVHVGGRCTIGDGSCYANERASCTWCGDFCKSRCIPDGLSCDQYCL